MYMRGPMHPAMRIGILALFGSVFLMMFAPMCIGIPVFTAETAGMYAEYAPTDEDVALAAELQQVADEAGLNTRITPVVIAQARRNGQLDEVEEAVYMMAEASGEQLVHAGRRTDLPPVHVEGAYYPDDDEAEESADNSIYVWAGLTFAAMLAFIGACAFAVMSMFGGDDDEPEIDIDGAAGPPV